MWKLIRKIEKRLFVERTWVKKREERSWKRNVCLRATVTSNRWTTEWFSGSKAGGNHEWDETRAALRESPRVSRSFSCFPLPVVDDVDGGHTRALTDATGDARAVFYLLATSILIVFKITPPGYHPALFPFSKYWSRWPSPQQLQNQIHQFFYFQSHHFYIHRNIFINQSSIVVHWQEKGQSLEFKNIFFFLWIINSYLIDTILNEKEWFI